MRTNISVSIKPNFMGFLFYSAVLRYVHFLLSSPLCYVKARERVGICFYQLGSEGASSAVFPSKYPVIPGSRGFALRDPEDLPDLLLQPSLPKLFQSDCIAL